MQMFELLGKFKLQEPPVDVCEFQWPILLNLPSQIKLVSRKKNLFEILEKLALLVHWIIIN